MESSRSIGAIGARAALAAASVVLVVAGCEAPTGSRVGNLPPETYLFISDAETDTTSYVVDLHWWGSDPDGDVVEYQFRIDSLWTPDPTDTLTADDPPWVRTVRTERTFTLPVEGTGRSAVVTFRAVDDAGAIDPMPVTQTFHLRNRKPTLEFGTDLARPTRSLPAVTFSVVAEDPEGDETIVGYRVWFDGEDRETDARTIPGPAVAQIALGPDDFPSAGALTINIVAVDDSNTESDRVLRHTWDVIDTEAKRVLIVDQYPAGGLFDADIAAFWRNVTEARLSPDEIITFDYTADGGFRTTAEVELSFSAFEAVIWYSGLQPNNLTQTLRRIQELRRASQAMERYTAGGGNVLLSSTFAFGNAVNPTEGAASAAWDSAATYRLLRITREFTNPQGNTNFLLFPTITFGFPAEWALPTTHPQGLLNYVDFLAVPTRMTRLMWVPPGSLNVGFDDDGNFVQNEVDYDCAFRIDTEGGGAFVIATLPLSRLNPITSGETFVNRAFDAFGL